MIPFLDRLRVAGRGTGMGDNRTLVIPVAPTIYWEIDREVREQMKISDGLIRVSIGLEDPHDLIRDFDEALQLCS
jgi:O-acetylhomoserine (thiol)-lyase